MKRDKSDKQKREAAKILAYQAKAVHLDALRERPARATKPIFRWDDLSGPPEPIGTGVLFSFGFRVVLLTAAHVFRRFKNRPSHIPVNGRIVPVIGMSRRSPLPSTIRPGDDKIDAGFFVMEGPHTEPFRKDALTIKDFFLQDFFQFGRMAILGYSAAEISYVRGVCEARVKAIATNGAKPSIYEHLRLLPTINMVMGWSKRVYLGGGTAMLGPLEGMSGSGVWLVPGLTDAPFPAGRPIKTPKLTGIFIQQRERPAVLIATNVSLHLKLLASTFPGELDDLLKAEFEEALAYIRGQTLQPWKVQ